MSIEKIEKLKDNEIETLESLVWMKLSDISLEDIVFFDNTLKNNYELSISCIEEYEKFLLTDRLVDEDIFFLIFLIIVFYYVNNSFYNKIDSFLAKISW